MIELTNPELKFALESTHQAARLVKEVQAEMIDPALTKDDRSPVTVADFASQALVAQLLEQSFPADVLVAEEDSTELQTQLDTLQRVTGFVQRRLPGTTSQQVCGWIDRGGGSVGERYWTLDPIDGTKGFLRGDQYAVALALVVEGKVQIGVLGCPNLKDGTQLDPGGPGSLVVAARDQGTWTTPIISPGEFIRLHVSNIADPTRARVLRSFESGHTNVSQIDLFAQAMGTKADPVRLDSQAKYALLAGGSGELMLRLLSPSKPGYREKIWDQAAGSLVLEEAGGRLSDIDGKRLDFTSGRSLVHNRGVVASNAHLHAAALKALAEIGA
jgi:3'(2'), 5'-bisphosphate nucleotidase